MAKTTYKRILLKVSGEVLAGDQSFGIEPAYLEATAKQIVDAAKSGVQIAIVPGGGNIFRGMSVAAGGADRVTADMMGTLGTVINALALSSEISRQGVKSKVFSATTMPSVADTYTAREAKAALDDGFVVVLGGGTGNPFFTTDTTAVLRAAELDAEAVLKASNVDGVYSADPKRDPNATRFDRLTHQDALSRDLKVMDSTAFALARENHMPIIVFSIREPRAVERVLLGEGRATFVGG